MKAKYVSVLKVIAGCSAAMIATMSVKVCMFGPELIANIIK